MAACQYEAQIRATAIRYGINPDIAVAQIMQESGCRPLVCSSAGACGIAQFMPGTAQQYGLTDRTNVQASLDAWGRYMSDLLSRFGGDYRLALAGYHSGAGAAQKALNNCKGNPKTCGYVNSILGSARSAGSINGDASTTGSTSPLLLVAIGVLVFLAFR